MTTTEEGVRWYEKRALPRETIDKLVREGGFVSEIEFLGDVNNPPVGVGSKFEMLYTNGLILRGTITRRLPDIAGTLPSFAFYDEAGIVGGKKGDEYILGTGANREIHDAGYRLVDKFPWEK